MSRYILIRLAASISLFVFLGSARLTGQGNVPDPVPNAARSGVTVARPHEDFTSLTLTGSDLHSEAPILGGRSESAEFVREFLRVQWRPGDPIDLYVIRPRGAEKPPVVLYLYGYPSETDRFRDDGFCRRAVLNGAAAVGFVSALTGHRYANRPMKEWFVSELPESLATTVHDVQMILNYLETRGDLDMSRVGMFGEGSGGAIAILAASADPRIKALDLLQPWGDWPDWLAESRVVPDKERPDYLKPDFLKKVEPLEPGRYLPQLKGRSIRIQYVDDSAPKLPTKVMEAAAHRNAQVLHYKSAEDLLAVSSEGRLFQWISDRLTPAAEAGTPAQAQAPAAAKDGGVPR